MFKNKINELLKVRYNVIVLKKLGGIKMINVQFKSGIFGIYMYVCYIFMVYKLYVCVKYL